MSKKKKRTIVIISITLLLLIGISYALLKKTVYGEKGRIIYHTGELDVVLEEDSMASLELENTIPITDEDGKKSDKVYRFSVVNNSSTNLDYTIYLDDDSKALQECGDSCEKMSDSFIKYELRKGEESKVNTLTDRKLKEDNVKAKDRNTYELRLWLGSEADNSAIGKYFFGQIRVEVVQNLGNGGSTAVDKLLTEYTNSEDVQDYDLEYTKDDPNSKENKMYVFNHKDNKGTQQSDWSEDELKDYRYIGKDPNNYVTFNDEEAGWRIIGIETVDDGSGKKEKRIKLIKKDPLPVGEDNWISWDNKPSGTGSSESDFGSNDWTDSRLMYLLNPNHETEQIGVSGSIYWNRQSGNCPKGQSNATTSCDFSEVGLLPEARAMIEDAKWYLGGSSTKNILTEEYYKFERSEMIYQSSDHPRKTNWTGKVGLMYPSDYGYATSGGETANREKCLTRELGWWEDWNDGILECGEGDWLFSGTQWTITPNIEESYYVFDISSPGGNVGSGWPDTRQFVRPTIYLSSSVKYQQGDGSLGDPFIFTK